MAASLRLIPTSMAEGLLHSLPTAFFSRPSSLPLLRSHKPLPFLNLSRPSSSLFPRKKPPSLLPLVAQTSDWARQEEDAEQEEEEASEGDDGGFDLEGLVEEGAEGGLFEGEEEVSEGDDGGFDLEGEEEEEQAAVGGVVAEEDRTIVDEGEEEVEEEEPFPEPPEEAKLFVGNLPYDMDSERLAQLFDKAGVVEVAEVIYNRATDQSRGFGFVTMNTVEDAEKAVEMYHRYEVSGRLLTVNKAAPRGSRVVRTPQEFEPSFRIYAANLPWGVDDSRLEQIFSEHGEVLEARVVYDRETGRSRGFGFVKMASQAEMETAIGALDGQSLDGRAIRVNVAAERPRRAAF